MADWPVDFPSSTAVKETVPCLIYIVPKSESNWCLPESVSHLSYNGVRPTAPLNIVHGVSLLSCDDVLQLQ